MTVEVRENIVSNVRYYSKLRFYSRSVLCVIYDIARLESVSDSIFGHLQIVLARTCVPCSSGLLLRG